MQRGRQAEADAAFHLRAHVVGVDGNAAVDRTNDPVDTETVIRP